MKYMVYELGFNACDGKPYYMAGKKEVKQAPHDRYVEGDHDLVHSASSGHRQNGSGRRRGHVDLG